MDTKRCPVCGASNSKIAKFCYACGADLRTDDEQAVSPVIETTATEPINEQLGAVQNQAENNRPPMPPNHAASNPYANQPPYGQPNAQPPQGGYPGAGGYQAPPPNPYGQPYQGGYQQMPPQGNPQMPYGYPIPPQPPYMPPMIPLGYSQKSKLVAGVLGILVGVFGVHNFYLGYTGKAVAQLLLTLLGSVFTCGLSAVAVWIWGLVEGVMILTGGIKTDGRNVPLSE